VIDDGVGCVLWCADQLGVGALALSLESFIGWRLGDRVL
jgi:hypothetical protein